MTLRPAHAPSAIALAAALSLFPAGARAADKVKVVPIPGHGEPLAAKTDGKGTIHVLYQGAHVPQYVKSTDNGKTFGHSIPLVDAASQKHGLEYHVWDMVVGQGGRVHVALGTNAWKLKRPQNEWGLYFTSLEPGAKSFAALRNINNKPSEGFTLAADAKGNVAACWLAGKLFSNVSHDNGKAIGPNREINPSYDPCDCCTVSATFGTDGKLAVLYREEANNERDMFVVLWDQETDQMTRTRISKTLWKIDKCPMTYYVISPTPDGYVAVWPTGDSRDIYFARLDHKGSLLSPGEIKTPGSAGHRTGMLALSAPDGDTLVAWTKNKQLGWQLYNAKGLPVGETGSAHTTGKGIAGVVDKEGGFILFR